MSARGLLVHEWYAVHGGSERVFDSMVDAFPDADLLVLWSDVENPFPGRQVRETWLARTPLRKHKALAMPFAAMAWRRRRPADYDWVLANSHQFAHHLALAGNPDVRKLAMVHSPARYLWVPELDGRGSFPGASALGAPLRWLDRRRARESTSVAGNSRFVVERIARCWDVDARVVYPPVDVAGITRQLAAGPDVLSDDDRRVLDALPEVFVLGASRFIPYKRLDLVLRAADRLALPVVLAGAGPEEAALRDVAATVQVPVRFVRAPSTPLLRHLYARASVFVFPPVEDFGMMPVEALASGTPVVVGPTGGSREIVDGYRVGAVAEDRSAEALAEAAREALELDPAACRARAAAFAEAEFRSVLTSWVGDLAGRPAITAERSEVGRGAPRD